MLMLVVNGHVAIIVVVHVSTLIHFLLCKCLSHGVTIYISCYFTNIFCLPNLQKIIKEKFETNPICCLITYFGMNKVIFRVYVFFFIHACVKFHILSIRDMKLE